ncbi:hypothetical protein H4Q26_016180 [Puccinia striiformis f. sp. tritici PST-130]|nr:hypothetical protein Pst134EB_023297 [Puccinia striiformis f. sp. tritici]KAI9625642.1 hypothetical protein H4Q26_016180 [Puccinia striiformis f. sp. tritici PST-130]
MSRYFSLIALVLLIASCEVAGDDLDGTIGDTPFGCHKNVDAVCVNRFRSGKEQRLFWAIRLHPGTRDYLCSGGTKPQCCDHGKYQDIDDRNRIKVIPAGKIPGCQAGGQ